MTTTTVPVYNSNAEARAVAAEERATMEHHEYLKTIKEITQLTTEEARAAVSRHQVIAETLTKIMQRLT